MNIEHEKMRDGIILVKKEKRKMEKAISNILKAFELNTGLKPGVVFHERTVVLIDDSILNTIGDYKVNIPVHL